MQIVINHDVDCLNKFSVKHVLKMLQRFMIEEGGHLHYLAGNDSLFHCKEDMAYVVGR